MDINNSQVRKNIADNLKKLRKEYDITQKNVSDVLGIDASSYRNWENERSTPSISALYELSKIFRVSVDDLCGIESDKKGNLTVANKSDSFNKSIYGESKITDLDAYEKQLVMQIRRLTNEDKRKVGKCISDLLENK
ncbi:MAG: helix-turn-helix transcriptional regulator [Eubacterium sp.]|nr:helix-turn-helix transcriptional regulator [Eubacterium sp.]